VRHSNGSWRGLGALLRYYSAEHEVVYFGVLGLVAIAIGVLLWLVGRPLRRLMSDDRAGR
jgi:POT family proton-dependent oligopeptide transporter